jgi:xylulokinase
LKCYPISREEQLLDASFVSLHALRTFVVSTLMSSYLLGIDIGTYESKGVLTDLHGQILAQAAVAHELSIPRAGWAEHDADAVWWHDFTFLCRDLLRQSAVPPQAIGAVGVSAIGPCVLPIDAAGHPLRPAILYGIDTRAAAEVEELTAALGAGWIEQTAGAPLSSQSAGPKILWLRRHQPETWARTQRILTSTSYLVYRLTGRAVIDHYTAAAYAPLYSLAERRWDEQALAQICPRALLPDLVWTTDVTGHVTPAVAIETGLAPGTPVIAGTADAAAEAVSGGAVHPGDLMLMYGTTLFFIQIVHSLARPGLLWPTVYLEPDSYALAGGMSTTGALTHWFRNHFAEHLLTAQQSGGLNAFGVLADEAARVSPGANGLLLLPYFSGERTPIHDPLARGLIAGLSLAHTRGHLYRALLEGVAYGIRHNLETFAASGGASSRLIAVGGGVKNRLWLQIVSDVTGQPQTVRTTPGAAYGDALLAGVGAGLLPSIDAVSGWLDPNPEIVRPDPAVKSLYDQYYALFRRLYEDTRTVTHRLAELGGA